MPDPPPLSLLQTGCPSCRQTNSVKALKAMVNSNRLANTRLSKDPAAADIHLHVSSCQASTSVCAHGPACLYMSQPLLSDECPTTCSTGSLAGSVLDTVITSITNAFSMTFCHLLVSRIHNKMCLYVTPSYILFSVPFSISTQLLQQKGIQSCKNCSTISIGFLLWDLAQPGIC